MADTCKIGTSHYSSEASMEVSEMAGGIAEEFISPRVSPLPSTSDDSPLTAAVCGSSAGDSPTTKWEHPPSFYCPISRQCMQDPVVLSDGHSYERRHIERWLEDHSTSPVSGLELPHQALFPNHGLRNAIEEYFQQVFSVHRRAIRKTMETEHCSNAALLRTIDALMQCSLMISSDLSTENILRRMMDEAKQLLGADVASVFLVDNTTKELVSSVNSTNEVLRIPLSTGIAGHVASTGESLIIKDVYQDPRFNQTMDNRLGYRTRSMMCVPLRAKKGGVIGIAQLINKVRIGARVDPSSSRSSCFCLHGEGREEELSFSADDLNFFEVFAAQASAAVATSSTLSEETMPDSAGRSEGAGVPEETAEGKASQSQPDAKESIGALSATVEEMLQSSVQGWELDTLALAEKTDDKPLSTLGAYLFDSLGLVRGLDLDKAKLSAFLEEVERGYEPTFGGTAPYHNRAHAASVLHCMHAIVQHGNLAQIAARAFQSSEQGSEHSMADGSGKLETLACLLAAAVHDYEHLGLNNDFLVKTGHERAVRHNDQHVNESHHAAAAFALLEKPELNFLNALPRKAFQRLRKLVIELVLATDMAKSGSIVTSFKSVLESSSSFADQGYFQPQSVEDAMLLLQMSIKCADLGHLTLSWELHMSWVHRLETEFFAQGDREKDAGLAISFLMDRQKPGASETQLGFFDFVVLPLFRSLLQAVPGVSPMLASVEANYVAYGGSVAPAPTSSDHLPQTTAGTLGRKSRSRCGGSLWRYFQREKCSTSDTE
eukprot:TRINITY_DN27929_c0_g2_i1.p1 TRINITY_DN27929_c0_g2~~TRINITY_DN27929_c0_g2_i1.p1  ORF type:complete len:774 (-),score=127.47 TRINITY_DN27929_c0_g2_i1:79-2400(-)